MFFLLQNCHGQVIISYLEALAICRGGSLVITQFHISLHTKTHFRSPRHSVNTITLSRDNWKVVGGNNDPSRTSFWTVFSEHFKDCFVSAKKSDQRGTWAAFLRLIPEKGISLLDRGEFVLNQGKLKNSLQDLSSNSSVVSFINYCLTNHPKPQCLQTKTRLFFMILGVRNSSQDQWGSFTSGSQLPGAGRCKMASLTCLGHGCQLMAGGPSFSSKTLSLSPCGLSPFSGHSYLEVADSVQELKVLSQPRSHMCHVSHILLIKLNHRVNLNLREKTDSTPWLEEHPICLGIVDGHLFAATVADSQQGASNSFI